MAIQKHISVVGVVGVSLLLGACQIESLREDFAREAPVRVAELDPSGAGDLALTLAFREPVVAQVMLSTDPDAEPRPVARVTGERGGRSTWIDAGALAKPGVRYYRLRVDVGGESWQGAEEWAVFVQVREPGQRYLVSVPVELGADGRLNGPLGQQVACGLHPGATTNDADSLQYLDAKGGWQMAYLLAGAEGVPQWWDAQAGAACEAAIEPGRAFWITRGQGAGHRTTHGLFWGRTITKPYTVAFRGDDGRATPFGLPWSRPLAHRRAVVGAVKTPIADPLGFGPVGSGGRTSDTRRRDECGDQIWVWQDNEWRGYYWLMAHVGPAWDGRWWDNRSRDFADFALEPGVGYYYRHRPNRWGGTNFVWSPPLESKSLDSK
ncbi:MAG: hypothetical protein K8T26_04030 [Lentisphaerae bacterium]|nr:hypothetical protein [Lentisphaerota bacterium]